LSQRLIKETQPRADAWACVPLQDPGEYRRVSNWIGAAGSTIEEGGFIRGRPDRLPDAMNGLENYLHADAPDVLIQLAIIHAEFEAIHPFLTATDA